MNRFALLLVLVAGGASAQPSTINCRSSATNCNAAAFKSNGTGLVLDLSSSTATTAVQFQNGAGINFSLADSDAYIIRSASNTLRAGNGTASSFRSGSLTLGTGAGNDAIAVTTTGAWTHLGAGSNDRMKSDGTNVVVDTAVLSNGTFGWSGATNPKVLLDTSVGAQLAYNTNELFCDASKCAANVIFRPNPAVATTQDAVATPVGLLDATDRDRNGHLPMYGDGIRLKQLGGARHWGLEGRTLTINSFHNEGTVFCPRCTECGGTTITAFDGQICTDAGAATNSTIDGVDFRNFVTAASSGSVSSYASRNPETRRNQYLHMTWVGYVAATTLERVWYGLSTATLAASDTPTGDYAAFRFSTNASDTTWQACTRDNATTSCTSTGVTVTANHLYVLEVDCRDTAAGKCLFTVQDRYSNAAVTISKTTNLPTAATGMKLAHYCESLTTAAKTCGIAYGSLETY